MDTQSFSVTLSVSGVRLADESQRAVKCDLCVRLSLAKEWAVTIYTVSSLYTGEILQCISFVANGPRELLMPARLNGVAPVELVDMYRSILPKLAEFVHQTDGALLPEHSKG